MTRGKEIPRWECTGTGCRWEYLDPYAAEKGHRCKSCAAILGRKPTQTSILVADQRRWGHSITEEMKQQANDDLFAAVEDMVSVGWKRGEARQWYLRRAKYHAGVPT